MPVPRRLSILAAVVGVLVAACAGSPDGSTELTSSEVSTAPAGTARGTGTASSGSIPLAAPTPETDADADADGVTTSDSGTTSTTAGTSSTVASSTETASPSTETTSPTTGSTAIGTGSVPDPVQIRLRLDRRVADEATAGFAELVRSVLTDQRGWSQAGYVFSFDDADADYTVVLAEGDEVDQLCLPYDTFGRFSCQIGPVVALNADRWRGAVDSWPTSLDEYRTMLVNHEVGHLIGQHHPADRCPGAGQPAPVMAQQSSGVDPCTANPWPLPWEIACANLRLEPLAPPYERNISLTCGPDGPVG